MLNQSEREFQKRFVGNIAFYLDIDQHRQRTVLQRNVKAALSRSKAAEHPKEPGSMPTLENASVMANISQAPITTHEKRRSRGSRLEVDQLLRQVPSIPEAEIRLEPKSLKRKKAQLQHIGEPPTKRLKEADVRCHCEVTVLNSRLASGKILVRKSEQCTLQRVHDDKGHDSTIRISIDKPITIPAKELFVDVERNDFSVMTIADSYTLKISLRALNSKDPWPPIPIKDDNTNTSRLKYSTDLARSQRPLVFCKWLKLPTCPSDETMLDAKVQQGGRFYETEYGFVIEASWNKFKNVLEKLNAAFRGSIAAQCPRPISEPEILKEKAETLRIAYHFGDSKSSHGNITMRKFVTMGYFCPLCRERDFGCMYLLHFHLLTCHSLFKFHVMREETRGPCGVEIDVTIEADVADQYTERASNQVKDDRDFAWVKPEDPFDLTSYLAGDERWMGGSDSRNIAPGSFRSYKPSIPIKTSIAKKASRTADPGAVPDLPPSRRKKHIVPAASAEFAFFRTSSKRRLEEGELVSESDDDVDDTWLYHKHDEIIDDFSDVTRSEKKFLRRYDEHMLRERLNGKSYLADALVRFCRINKDWLVESGMRVEFSKLAAELYSQRTINESVVLSCQNIIGEGTEKEDAASDTQFANESKNSGRPVGRISQRQYSCNGASERVNGGQMLLEKVGLLDHHEAHDLDVNSDVRMRDAEDEVPHDQKNPESAAHPKISQPHLSNIKAISLVRLASGSCMCGVDIRNMKNAILCSRENCTILNYHLSCIGLKRRVPGWICEICRTKQVNI